MRAKQLFETIPSLVGSQIPFMLIGPPGCGKTSVLKQAAASMGYDVVLLHGGSMLVEDMGIPALVDGVIRHSVPYWWPTDPESKGVIIFDDFGQANTDIQKLSAHLMLERELHGHRLPQNWSLCFSSNRVADRAGANRILGHVANRMVMVDYDFSVDDWSLWALRSGVDPIVVAFCRFQPNYVQAYDPKNDVNPTARAWGIVDTIIKSGVSSDAYFEMFKGVVGEKASVLFTDFYKTYQRRPNIDAILLNPDTSDVPVEPAMRYAVTTALAHKATKGNMDRVYRYAKRLPLEFTVLLMTMATKRDSDLAETQAFIEFATENQEAIS